MGIIAIQRVEPYGYYCCKYCETPTAHLMDMEKLTATSGLGQICFIFKKSLNICKDISEHEISVNGKIKMSRDVSCINCNNSLGYKTHHKSYLFKSKLI